MASGGKELVINPRERALSIDQNRVQKFVRKDVAEMLRYWIEVTTNDDLDGGAIAGENSMLTTPLDAEVINGLMVRPQIGNTNLFVDPGVLLALAPDGGADDSNYKYVHDVGLTTPGSLVIAANASGSIRIDIIECSLTNTVVETASRDIFNTSSGLFAAASVTKATADSLLYRVTQGTPGAGQPSYSTGWLPLAIAIVPSGSANNDTVTFYDVRPIINDRSWGPSNMLSTFPTQGRPSMLNAASPGATMGYLEAQYNGRRLGGRLRRGSPGAEFPAGINLIDLTDAANQSNPFTITNGKPWFLYLLVPQGLPRWSRYTDAASGSRVPRTPRGIPVVSHVPPFQDGTPSIPIHMPAVFGFTANIATGVCVAAGYFAGGVVKGFYGDVDGYILANTGTSTTPIEVAGTNSVVAGFGFAQFDLTSGTHFPANARQILIECRADVNTDSGTHMVRQRLQVFAPNAGATQIYEGIEMSSGIPTGPTAATGGAKGNMSFTRWVPIAPLYPGTADFTQRITVEYDADGSFTSFGAGASHLRILGWKF